MSEPAHEDDVPDRPAPDPDSAPEKAALDERVAIVAGAGGALGRVVARDLAARGARIVLVGRRRRPLDDLAESIMTDTGVAEDRLLVTTADLTTPAGASSAVAAALDRFGRIDILAQLVGGWRGGATLVDLDLADVGAMLDQHLWVTVHMARAVVPAMTDRRWGRIVIVSATSATAPVPKMAAYASAKAAAEAVVVTLAKELAGTGVTANVVQVRAIDADHERDRDPSPRTASWATPEEISAAIAYLCSDAGGRVNGARLPLHGGG